MDKGPNAGAFAPFAGATDGVAGDGTIDSAVGGPARPDATELRIVAAIWFAALMLRLFNLLEIRNNDPFFYQPSVDPLFYHQWAARIAGGEVLGQGVFLQGPLYPYLLSVLYSVTGPDLLLPRLINCIAGSLVCVLVWGVAREVFGRRTALVASAITAVYGMFVFYEGSLLIVNVLLPLNLLVVWLCLSAFSRPSTSRWLGVGLLVGLAALARPNMLLYGPVAIVLLFAFVRGSIDVKQRSVYAGCLLVGIALVIAPSLIRNYVVAEDPVLISASAGMNFYNGNNPDANGTHNVPSIFDRSMADHPLEQNAIYKAYAEEQLGGPLRASEVSNYWFGRGLEYVFENPGAWLSLLAKKFALFINGDEIWNNRSIEVTRQFSWVLRLPLLGFAVVGPLALLGLVLTARRWRSLLALYALIGVYLATSVGFFVLSRYRIPVVPVFIIFAGAAVVWLFDAARMRRREFGIALVGLGTAAVMTNISLHTQDLSVAYYNLGNKYRLMNRHEEAIAQYRASLDINSSYISAHNNLALSLELSGRHRDEAIAAWTRLGEIGRARGLKQYVERAERHLNALRGS